MLLGKFERCPTYPFFWDMHGCFRRVGLLTFFSLRVYPVTFVTALDNFPLQLLRGLAYSN